MRLTRRHVVQGMASGTGLALANSIVQLRSGKAIPAAAFAPQPGPLVRSAWWTDVGRLTPFQVSATGPAGVVLLTLLYDTLTWKDERGIIPWLASEWSVDPDGTRYSFRLVDGVTWHDGMPLTAGDVAFSFDYYARFPYVWMSTDAVDGVEVESELEVAIRLKRPYAPFLEEIAGGVPIIPRHIWEPVTDPIADARPESVIGSGPFVLAAHDPTAGAYQLTANERYWRGRPRIAEWRQLTVPPATQFEAAAQGDIDLALSTDASVRDLFADDARLDVHETAPLSIVRLVVNTERAPLDRKEVRQALAYALDRGQIAETITRGPAIVGSPGVVPPETPWFNPSLPAYDYDPERARALLGGEELTIDLIADANAREPDLMLPMLEAIGITLNIQRVDAPTRVQLLDEGNFQLALTSHIGVGGDPDYLRRWYAGEEANAFAKGSIFHNEEYAKLGEESAAELDPGRRREIVFRMQEILAGELPTIVLYHRRFYWVYDPSVLAPMATWGGLMNGIPFPDNKLTLIES